MREPPGISAAAAAAVSRRREELRNWQEKRAAERQEKVGNSVSSLRAPLVKTARSASGHAGPVKTRQEVSSPVYPRASGVEQTPSASPAQKCPTAQVGRRTLDKENNGPAMQVRPSTPSKLTAPRGMVSHVASTPRSPGSMMTPAGAAPPKTPPPVPALARTPTTRAALSSPAPSSCAGYPSTLGLSPASANRLRTGMASMTSPRLITVPPPVLSRPSSVVKQRVPGGSQQSAAAATHPEASAVSPPAVSQRNSPQPSARRAVLQVVAAASAKRIEKITCRRLSGASPPQPDEEAYEIEDCYNFDPAVIKEMASIGQTNVLVESDGESQDDAEDSTQQAGRTSSDERETCPISGSCVGHKSRRWSAPTPQEKLVEETKGLQVRPAWELEGLKKLASENKRLQDKNTNLQKQMKKLIQSTKAAAEETSLAADGSATEAAQCDEDTDGFAVQG
eukprot:TRINITY_DN101285_c0_g1_i1.p1 TRINITY_DN101285_c0_g1~~TRINITY_DN101285_c0_g1_i1.p1  ORF type:complete len:451 (-),score=70.07 TRINITY_DN101285_c0_g1_i1:93-1445(-)